jgi:hypothetical protein
MNWYVENIPLTNPFNKEFYPFKRNVKAISVIGIEYLQAYMTPVVKIYIDENIYFALLGKVIYFPDSRYIENIGVCGLYIGGTEYYTKATIIYQEG